MKSVAVISPEEVPFSIESNSEKYKTFFASGQRAWQISRVLAETGEFDVYLFIPDTAIPTKESVQKAKLPFKLKTYSHKAALWDWSSELDRKLKTMDFVIVQTSYGIGFLNCSVLPSSVNVIVDGFYPILAEIPGFLLGNSKPYRRVYWERFVNQYFKLLKRANCILYANDRQYYYYEGQLFSYDKLGWNAFHFSPLLKVPYGTDSVTQIKKTYSGARLKLIWYGPIYPWHNPEKLLEIVGTLPDVTIDFYNITNNSNKKIFKNFFQEFFDKWKGYKNISIHSDDEISDYSIFNDYDAGILLSRDWIEENYSIRTSILEMLSSGLPVIVNSKNSWFGELGFPKDSIYPITPSSIEKDLVKYKENKNSLRVSDSVLSEINNLFMWEKAIEPLIEYIHRF